MKLGQSIAKQFNEKCFKKKWIKLKQDRFRWSDLKKKLVSLSKTKVGKKNEEK